MFCTIFQTLPQVGRWASSCCVCCSVSSTKLKRFSLTGISNFHFYFWRGKKRANWIWPNCQTSLPVGGQCLLRLDVDEDVAHDVGGGPGGKLIKRPTSTAEARPLDRRALIKLCPNGSIRESSRLHHSPPLHTSVRKLHRHTVWSGPAMLWAGVSTNVLIRWGRKLQVLFCWGKKKCGKTDGKVGAQLHPRQLQVGQSLSVSVCVASSDIWNSAHRQTQTLHFH